MACGLHRLALRSLVFCGVVYYNKSIRIKPGKLHIVLSNGIYVDTLNLMPRIQNQIRSMAAFDNPVFYKNKRLGYSSYYHFGAIYMGKMRTVTLLFPAATAFGKTAVCSYLISERKAALL